MAAQTGAKATLAQLPRVERAMKRLALGPRAELGSVEQGEMHSLRRSRLAVEGVTQPCRVAMGQAPEHQPILELNRREHRFLEHVHVVRPLGAPVERSGKQRVVISGSEEHPKRTP